MRQRTAGPHRNPRELRRTGSCCSYEGVCGLHAESRDF